ncbi:malto-oligosyltrehalose trehalohydrolase [Acidocella sp.]|uniref:malto-oligosyltrehalose trehalohydrolase n=1 Tax=Acidocella sp. TaxID=50710 RepID=UPI002629898E|nr:malto-oligosyltrehalose trehalohydrolase [Acidocella sp.]
MRHGDFGARLLAPDTVEFRLWAPDAGQVAVMLKSGAHEMRRDASGIFSVTAHAAAGEHYKFRINNDTAVPDPASRRQSRDVHDESVIVNPAYAWRHPHWRGRPWHESIIYEVHPGAYGGFAGILAQLPRLAAMGITAIELMPIADFPGKHNWGYDGVLPYAPDTAYGTTEDLRQLIDAAHGCKLQIFLDVVYNHFGPDGNYLNAYAKSFFRDDIQTPWGSAIDFRRPQVRRFFIENALYWLHEYRFDGLRFDAVHAIGDEGFLLEMAAEIRSSVPPGRHVHLILENENNDAALLRADPAEAKFDAQWTDDWHHCLHVLLTGESEGYYGDFKNAADQLARCLSEGFAYQGEASAYAQGAARGSPSGHLPGTAFVICLQNHDQIGNRALGERLTALAAPRALRAAVALLLLTPQIPMLFMGEEWGETRPFLYFTDHEPELGALVREGRRKEFTRFAAFANPQTRNRIPDPNAHETFHISRPVPAENEWSTLYAACLEARHAHITARVPDSVSLGATALAGAAVRAAWRMNDGAILTVAVNLGAAPVACDTPEHEVLFSTDEAAGRSGMLAGFTTMAWLTCP